MRELLDRTTDIWFSLRANLSLHCLRPGQHQVIWILKLRKEKALAKARMGSSSWGTWAHTTESSGLGTHSGVETPRKTRCFRTPAKNQLLRPCSREKQQQDVTSTRCQPESTTFFKFLPLVLTRENYWTGQPIDILLSLRANLSLHCRRPAQHHQVIWKPPQQLSAFGQRC